MIVEARPFRSSRRLLDSLAIAVLILGSSTGCATAPAAPRSGVPAPLVRMVAGGYLSVDNVQACGETLRDARENARHIALRAVLDERGLLSLPEEVREELDDEAEDLMVEVAVRDAVERDGFFCPFYSYQVDLEEIDAVIRESRQEIREQAVPTVGVALSLCTLPRRFERDRASLAALLNDRLKGELAELGYETELSTVALEKRVRGHCDDLGAREEFLDNQLRTTTYLVYGRADIHEDAIEEISYGASRTHIDLSLRFLSVSDGVEFVRTISTSGTGASERASLQHAFERAVRQVLEGEVADELEDHWERKLRDGFTYDVIFCQMNEPDDWVRIVRDNLAHHGEYVGTGPSIVIGGATRRTWRFHAAPGEFVRPGPDFLFFLEHLQQRDGDWVPGLMEVNVGPRLLDSRVYYMFGDDAQVCFADGGRARYLD